MVHGGTNPWLLLANSYTVGLDNSAAMDLIAGDAGNASVVAAHNTRKDARERAGNNINLSLQKLEKV